MRFRLIVRRELQDLVTGPRFAVTFGVVSLLVLLAFTLGASNYRLERSRHEAAVAEDLRQLDGKTDWGEVRSRALLPPDPLAALVSGVAHDVGRSVDVDAGALAAVGSLYGEAPLLATWRFLDLEFVFRVVLSLFAILFAFDAVSGEKERGTLRLALANPVPRDTFILGKLTGYLLGLLVPLLLPVALGCLILVAFGVPMGPGDWGRLALVLAAGCLYLAAVLGGSMLVSARTHRSATAFLVLLVVWIGAALVLPPASVLLAARAVEVPSVDDAISQRVRLTRQLRREDEAAMHDFLEKRVNRIGAGEGETEPNPGRIQKLQAEINRFLEGRNRERKAALAALDSRLEEDRRNLRRRQEGLALGLARVSPAAAFTLAATTLAGTSLALPQRFLDQVHAYQEVFERFRKEKTGLSGGGFRIVLRSSADEPQEPQPIDPGEMPVFTYREPGVAAVLPAALGDLALLAFYDLLLFAGAFVAFLRYDVR